LQGRPNFFEEKIGPLFFDFIERRIPESARVGLVDVEAQAGHLRAVGDDLGPLVDDEPGDGRAGRRRCAGGGLDDERQPARPDRLLGGGRQADPAVAGAPRQLADAQAQRLPAGGRLAVYMSAISSREAPSRTCAARWSQVIDASGSYELTAAEDSEDVEADKELLATARVLYAA